MTMGNKCDCRGEEYEESFLGKLDNTSGICYNCIKNEEQMKKKITNKKIKEN